MHIVVLKMFKARIFELEDQVEDLEGKINVALCLFVCHNSTCVRVLSRRPTAFDTFRVSFFICARSNVRVTRLQNLNKNQKPRNQFHHIVTLK